MRTIEAPREATDREIERAPRWARWFVWSFLAALLVCGVVGIDAWPLTGFRLFSHLRYDHQTEWQAFAVRTDGSEARLRLARFPGGYNGFPLVMRNFESRSPGERSDMCRAWLAAASGLRDSAVAIRIYVVDRRLEPRHGRRAASVPRRTLAYTCAGGVVRPGGSVFSASH
ncbi:MAG TPA: hypothetical protein VFA92_11255 [Candidatus Binatia bacterium]|jgi:hypothetical protein|nr:hypothetical protein [Candidatus Binatia bacterium]